MGRLSRKDETLEVEGRQEEMTIERNVRRKTNTPDFLFTESQFPYHDKRRGKVRFRAYS